MTKRRSAAEWAELLDLNEHPEGGYYKEIYRAPLRVRTLDDEGRERDAATSIYYLVVAERPSTFHRVASDELWHFYAGDPVTLHCIDPDGRAWSAKVGPDPDAGQTFCVLLPAGTWFGAIIDEGGEYALCGCTVAPGFEFRDFDLATRDELLDRFPQHRAVIERLTPGQG